MRREQSLNSSALSRAGYDDETQVLDLTWNNGQTSTHNDVPPEIFDGLISSSSPGRYYHSVIKGTYG